MIRSTTDAMLAARHDPEPYVYESDEGVQRLGAEEAINNGLGYFVPRVRCVPSRYLVLLGPRGGRWREWRGIAASWDDAIEKAEAANPGWDVHTAGLDVENPRPEPNPILVAFRGYDASHRRALLRDRAWEFWLNTGVADLQHRADARKVLTRLANWKD